MSNTHKGNNMQTNLKGAPKPDIVAEARRIMVEQNVGMNRAFQLASHILRDWAIANGYGSK